MKGHLGRNVPIDGKRMRGWEHSFATFHVPVTENKISAWLDLFQADRDLGARILDCVTFYTHDQMVHAFRDIMNGLDGWSIDEGKRKGQWRFAAYSSSAGESGDAMLAKLRHANGLSSKKFNPLFIGRSEILMARLGDEDTLVLVDDFTGSGKQVCDAWNEQFSELCADVGRVILIVVAAGPGAARKIQDETDLDLVPHFHLTARDSVFAAECTHFDAADKQTLLRLCAIADKRRPEGYGQCGLLVVFPHSCPNNTIPILHAINKKWHGIFPRYAIEL